jgi:D-glycero-D-manno-heptose 1,7-bisphosphate phosphatase
MIEAEESHPVAQAVILVGGMGTRLGALTAGAPKPLLSVGGKPFLDYLVTRCRIAGVRRIVLLAGYLSEQVTAYASTARTSDLEIEVVIEDVPLGTAGALAQAGHMLDSRFLMMNGDSLFDCDWSALIADVSTAATGLLALREMPDAGRYGKVEVDGSRIVAFHEKQANAGAGLVNGGLYLLDRSVLDLIQPGPSSLERDVFPVLVARKRLEGRVLPGAFIDIGVPEDFERSQTLVPQWTRDLMARARKKD